MLDPLPSHNEAIYAREQVFLETKLKIGSKNKRNLTITHFSTQFTRFFRIYKRSTASKTVQMFFGRAKLEDAYGLFR